jgi:hypothetical protein
MIDPAVVLVNTPAKDRGEAIDYQSNDGTDVQV